MILYKNSTALITRYKIIVCSVIAVFTIGLIFYQFPHPIVSDHFNIHSYSKVYELFNLIISSIVSLIGIYISVSLVAYEIFKQKSGIDFHESFLGNRINALFVSVSVSAIIFSFLSSVIVASEKPSYNDVTLIYYNIYLFVVIIAFLFPVAFNLFSSFKPEKLIDSELHKLNNESIFIKVDENDDIDKEMAIIEKDHLVKIENITIAIISVSDNIKAQAIIQKVTLKISTLIIEEDNPRRKEYIISRLISFYIKIIDFSLLQPNNNNILNCIWNSVYKMYYLLIERQESAKNYEKFREEFLERYFNRLFENNKLELIIEGVSAIKDIISDQIFSNMPKDAEITFLDNFRRNNEKDFIEREEFSDKDLFYENHWKEVALELVNVFSFVMNKAINSNKPEIINNCTEQMNKLSLQFHLKGIGVYKQTYFYLAFSNIICDYIYKAFEKNIFNEGSEAKHLIPSIFEELIKGKHPAARMILVKYCYLLMHLQKLGKLDYWFLGGISIGNIITTEGELGGMAKICAINFNDGKEIQDCLSDCINCFETLKNYYENHPPNDSGLYMRIKEQFKNILYWLNYSKVEDKTVLENLNRLINSFKKIESEPIFN